MSRHGSPMRLRNVQLRRTLDEKNAEIATLAASLNAVLLKTELESKEKTRAFNALQTFQQAEMNQLRSKLDLAQHTVKIYQERLNEFTRGRLAPEKIEGIERRLAEVESRLSRSVSRPRYDYPSMEARPSRRSSSVVSLDSTTSGRRSVTGSPSRFGGSAGNLLEGGNAEQPTLKHPRIMMLKNQRKSVSHDNLLAKNQPAVSAPTAGNKSAELKGSGSGSTLTLAKTLKGIGSIAKPVRIVNLKKSPPGKAQVVPHCGPGSYKQRIACAAVNGNGPFNKNPIKVTSILKTQPPKSVGSGSSIIKANVSNTTPPVRSTLNNSPSGSGTFKTTPDRSIASDANKVTRKLTFNIKN